MKGFQGVSVFSPLKINNYLIIRALCVSVAQKIETPYLMFFICSVLWAVNNYVTYYKRNVYIRLIFALQLPFISYMETTELSKNKIEALFKQPFITAEDYNNLSPDEKVLFKEEQARLFKELKGKELSALLDKVHETLPANLNEELWELNHDKICSVINKALLTNNRMPSKTEIAKETGLSVVTIRKHLKEHATNLLNIERKEQYKFMESALMAALYNKSIMGDVNAMKFFFEATGLHNTSGKGNNIIANQHNYIQINNLKLSQEELEKLSPEQLKQIEAIVRENTIGRNNFVID